MASRRSAPLLVVLALVLVACGGGSKDADKPSAGSSTTAGGAATTGPAEEGPEGFRPDPITWRACESMECASVEVPVDYAHADGRHITLSVTRSRATGDRIGPLFVNPGGPGGSAAEFAQALPLYLPETVVDRFDIVGVEPRGIKGSAPIDCGVDYTELYSVDPTVEDAADRTKLIDTAKSLADHCESGAGDMLAHVGTRDVARDLDAVRAAMGEAQLSYYGASYGTAIGQIYADLFPGRIRSMVLDGVVELGPTGLEGAAEQAKGFETALANFADDCKATGNCRTDDPLAAVTTVIARSERPGGIPTPNANRPAGPGEVNLGLGEALYSKDLWPYLDRALATALDGDGSAVVQLADEYLSLSFDIYFAVNCIDFAWPTGDPDAFLAAGKAAATESPHFGEALVTDYLRCVDWPVAADPLPAVTAPDAPPILVVSTTGDPATPYESGVAVAHRLKSGVLLTYDGEGHGAIGGGSSCINAQFAAYLVDGNVPRDGTVCD